jgi:hypothetical protein
VEDTQLAALAFLGMINYSYTWFDPEGKWSPDLVAERFCDMFLSGIDATSFSSNES